MFIDNAIKYRWGNCVEGFSMPVRISLDGKNFQFIFPTTQWQTFKISTTSSKDFRVDRNFYIIINETK
jgi:hypothetical protein